MRNPKLTKEDANFGHVLTKSNAEIQAEIAERSKDPFYGKVEVLSDPQEKQVAGFDPYSEVDPMTAILRPVREAGYAYKLCSPRVASHYGSLGGYEQVKDQKGNEVKLGNMFLGKIPQEVADKRKAFNYQQALESVRDQQDTYESQTEELRAKAREVGMALTPLGSGDAASYGDGNRERKLGIEVSRGDIPA